MCVCDCGGLTIVNGSNLKSGSVKACGCLAPRPGDLAGEKKGRLTAVRSMGVDKGKSRWVALCDCGDTLVIASSEFSRLTDAASCGCVRKAHQSKVSTIHGLSRSPTYRTWSGMRTRVSNPNAIDWHLYGGRGITADPRWDSFEAFLSDMGHRPPGTSLDRRDGNLGYFKENCRWASSQEQAVNRSTTKWVNLPAGRITVSEYARVLGVSWHIANRSALTNGLL